MTGERVTCLYTGRIHMSTTIRVSDETKVKLERIKREEESFDELLARLADVEDGMKDSAGAWSGTKKAEKAREAVRESRGSFRAR